MPVTFSPPIAAASNPAVSRTRRHRTTAPHQQQHLLTLRAPRQVAARRVQSASTSSSDTSRCVTKRTSVGEIAGYLGVDSLAYLDLDRTIAATGCASESFCTACFTGEYPVAVPESDTKMVLEEAADLRIPGTIDA